MTFGISSALARRARFAGAIAAVLALAAACGGSGDTVSEFDPQRLIAFGDEASVLTDAQGSLPRGRKYSVNAVEVAASAPVDDFDPPGNADCESNPIWIQVVAERYGFGFDQCAPRSTDTPQRAKTYAAPGAKVADVIQQVATHRLTSSFGPRDLVLLYAGPNDIVEIYGSATSAADCDYDSADPDSSGSVALLARARGEELAGVVNGIGTGDSGGRILVSTVANQGATPYAVKQTAANTDFDRAECLESLTNAFNGGLVANLRNDGRYIGLVFFDQQVQLIVDNADDFNYDNITTAACAASAPLPNCSVDDLIEDATENRYMWADDRQFGIDLHDLLGRIAVRRIDNLPF